MSDPLSIAGTAAGLISLGIQVTQSLVEFYNAYKSQDSAIAAMIKRLEGLSDTFQCLEKALLDRNVQTETDEQSLINIERCIQNCDELIHELQEECQRFHKASSNGILAAVRVAGRRASYPFRQTTLQNLNGGIGEIRDNLSFALDVLNLNDSQRTQDSIAEVNNLLELIRTHQISSDLRAWLNAPDATVNHNTACEKKYPGTGMWLVKSPVFSRWLTEQNSILWLNGFAGCGKSVLCSTAIQFVLRHRGSSPGVGIAFFYFTFNDDSKQDESGMLRALLLQLSGQLQDGEGDLTRLHQSYKPGIPPPRVLIEYLRRSIQRFHHVYIALDGLDESPRNGPRQRVIDTLNAMRDWGIQGLHLFLTSRDEPDIRDSLDLNTEWQQVILRNVGIDRDIANSISGRLDTDRRLRKWLPHRDKIQETLAERAKGVFRWVECQLGSLQLCPLSEYYLDHMLNSLPQSLDETYERMLCNIDHYLIEDTRRILTLLCFAARPLTVQELIDGVAIEINNPPGLNYKRRLQDFDELCTICPGFIDIDLGTSHRFNSTPTVRIAHFSVQEYLESKRIRHQKAAIFSLISSTAHAEIAQICLVYLLENVLSSSKFDSSVLEEFPLAHFAAMHWNRHYQNTVKPDSGLDELVLRLFQHQDPFANWIKIHDEDKPWSFSSFNRKDDDIASPVYYASLLGLEHIVTELIRAAHVGDITTQAPPLMAMSTVSTLVNAQGGEYGSALQAASNGGHKNIVLLLLDKGADVNTRSGYYGNALQAASSKGHENIILLLLDKGADVNAQSGYYGNALLAASSKGHENIILLLLDKGADVNAQSEYYGNALQAASGKGHENIILLLLDKGADVNAQSGDYGNALQAASNGGHKNIVLLLLEKEVDVNAQGGRYGNALQAASCEGHENIILLLLDKGADINAQGGEYGNALQAASSEDHENIILLLLEKGADINAQGGYFGNALQAASSKGHENIILLLLEKGADINAQGGEYGNALQAASNGGYKNIVLLLLDKKADINAQGGYYGNALQAASRKGHENIILLLLEKGADINAQGGYFGNALQAASSKGHENIILLLLEKGADINAQGGEYGNALQAASNGGYKNIVLLLLDKGADVNAQGGHYGNALQAASCEGYENIVQLLLDKGADVNAQGGYHDNALQAASYSGHKNIVLLLLDKGADVNAQDGKCGNALQAASYKGHRDIVLLLLEKGVNVNAQGGYHGNALQAASTKGYKKLVQLLLEKGADVNAQGGYYYGNALQVASSEGHENIVLLLLEKGANVNAQGGYYGNALQAASSEGHENIVLLLLEKGANVNAQGGDHGNALQAASYGGHKNIVLLLLDKGADINAQGGRYDSALQAAWHRGHENIVQLLRKRGAVDPTMTMY